MLASPLQDHLQSLFSPPLFWVRQLAAGGDEGARTPDPLLAKQVLSQLSYTPKGIFQQSLEIEQQQFRTVFFVVCFVSL